MERFVAWAAPILSAIIVTVATASINSHIKHRDQVADERHAETEAKRAAEAAWRDEVDRRLKDIEEKMGRSVLHQALQLRSDIIHKCHRYLDDLGKASTEEKDALADEHKQYSQFCKDLDIDNDFIDEMVAKVKELPGREV